MAAKANRVKLFDTVNADWPVHLPVKIAFVGEAPGDDERVHGHPFVGPSGRVFDQLLRTAGLDRPQYLVTNVFDEQLPENEVGAWCAPTAERNTWDATYSLPRLSAGWLRPQYAHHLDRLRRELERAQPTVIVPLGGTALWALTGTDAITECRGAVGQASLLVPGVKLLPTLHPAHVIHEWRMFHIVTADLIKAAHEAEFPDIRLARRELWLEPTYADLDRYFHKYLEHADMLSVDIETAGGQITCIGFAPDSTTAIVVPFVDFGRPDRNYWPTVEAEVAAWQWVEQVLMLPMPKLFQNGLYDVFWLLEAVKIHVRNYSQDTRLLHHALYPELPKSLGFMGASYANAHAWKTMRAKKAVKRDE